MGALKMARWNSRRGRRRSRRALLGRSRKNIAFPVSSIKILRLRRRSQEGGGAAHLFFASRKSRAFPHTEGPEEKHFEESRSLGDPARQHHSGRGRSARAISTGLTAGPSSTSKNAFIRTAIAAARCFKYPARSPLNISSIVATNISSQRWKCSAVSSDFSCSSL